MICHFSSHSKASYNRTWAPIMNMIASEMSRRGYMLTKDAELLWNNGPEFGNGMGRTPDVVIYTNCNKAATPQRGLYVGLQGPMPGYFSIDSVGVWPHLAQTYNKELNYPNYCNGTDIDSLVENIKKNKINHYNNKNLNLGIDSPEITDCPEDHVLLIMNNGDLLWTPTWTRFANIVNNLLTYDQKVVVKFEPEITLDNEGNIDEIKKQNMENLFKQFEGHITCYWGNESLHDILPKTKVCIMDDLVYNLEPFMYDVPIITHMAPPYRHAVKQIYHEHELIPAVNDICEWFDADKQRLWFNWYITSYLCNDEDSIRRRLEDSLI